MARHSLSTVRGIWICTAGGTRKRFGQTIVMMWTRARGLARDAHEPWRRGRPALSEMSYQARASSLGGEACLTTTKTACASMKRSWQA